MAVKFSAGWKKFLKRFSGQTRKEVRAELRQKIREQLGLLRRDVISYIDSEKHGVPNSPLTILVKGSSRSLVDRGDLRMVSVRTESRRNEILGGVGVLRTRRSRDGKVLWNIAVALHEGFVVRVTPQVRAAVFAEMRKRRGKKVRFGGGGGSKLWRVKARPFIREPLEVAETRIRLALGDAVKVTFQK